MNLFSLFFCDIDGISSVPEINPATGLPMVDGIGGFDLGGNPYGMDSSPHLSLESGSPFDPFDHSGSSGGGGLSISGFTWD